MIRDDSRHPITIPIPSGCEDPSKELESIKWIFSSLGVTQRLPSCKRRDALVSILTSMLELPLLPSYSELRNQAQSLQKQVEGKEEELKELQMDLDKISLQSEVDFQDYTPSLTQFLRNKGFRKFGIRFTLVGFGFAILVTMIVPYLLTIFH